MKRKLGLLGALVAAGALLSLVFPAPRHAIAEAVNFALGAPGSAAPTQALQVGGSDGTNIQALPFRAISQNPVPAMVPFVSDAGGVSNPALYDQTTAVNTALDTGIIDVSAWRQIIIFVLTSAGTIVTNVYDVDDAGVAWYTLTNPVASQATFISLGPGMAPPSANGPTGTTVSVPMALPRRIRVQAPAAGVGNTIRCRIEGRR